MISKSRDLFQIIVLIVTNKDSNNRLTFVDYKTENDLQFPNISVFSNISSFSYNIFEVKNIEEPYNSNFHGCEFNYLNGNSSCPNHSNYSYYITDYNTFNPIYLSSKITYQKTYIRIILLLYKLITNVLKNPNATLGEKELEKSVLIEFQYDSYVIISPPAKVQFSIKKEVYIDKHGIEKVHLIPSVITTPFPLAICNNFTSNEIIHSCYTIDISFSYASDVVLYYTDETDRQYITRVLADISSISRLILYVIFYILTFFISRFLFDQKTAWFPNSIRDGVLYHYKYYRVQNNIIEAPKEPPIIFRIISKLKNLFRKERNEFDLYEQRNQYEKLKDETYKIKKATEGSKIIYKRIFQSIDPQDDDSYNLSKVMNIKLWIFISLMLLISVIIIIKNAPNRMASTQFENQDLLELPKFNYSFIGNNVFWEDTIEILPNGDSRECKWFINSVDCKTSNNFEDLILIEGHNVSGTSNSIYMKKHEKFQFKVNYLLILNGFEVFNMNKMIIKLTINDIDHLFTPFSNVTIFLEKTNFFTQNKSIITMYDTNTIVSSIPYVLNLNGTTLFAKGTSYLNIQYPDNEVRTIKVETNFQLLKRLIQYILAFSSPISLILGFIFSNIVIRLLFKTPSAHCDPTVREPIIYFLKYYKKYPEIFKNK
ncbi:hypothetical protein ACTFIV_002763 [Dictyostelium citrinum]